MLGHCTVYNRRNCSHIHDRITHIQSTHTHIATTSVTICGQQNKQNHWMARKSQLWPKYLPREFVARRPKKKKKKWSKQGRTRSRGRRGCGGAGESVSAPRNQSGPDILARLAADKQIGAVAASFSLYLSPSPTPTSILHSQFAVSMTKTLLPQAPQQYTTTPPPPST